MRVALETLKNETKKKCGNHIVVPTIYTKKYNYEKPKSRVQVKFLKKKKKKIYIEVSLYLFLLIKKT